ncbi:MAG: caspase family protein [Bacteroidales bacterium]|nr:caspase family protein [Bacteroidales bacterium]
MKRLIFLLTFITILFCGYTQEKRLALVIDNGQYEHGGTLINPENDAKAIANALQHLGFDLSSKYYEQFWVETFKKTKRGAFDK